MLVLPVATLMVGPLWLCLQPLRRGVRGVLRARAPRVLQHLPYKPSKLGEPVCPPKPTGPESRPGLRRRLLVPAPPQHLLLGRVAKRCWGGPAPCLCLE